MVGKFSRDPTWATPAEEREMLEGQKQVLKGGALIGWAWAKVSEDMKLENGGRFAEVPPGYGEYSGMWMQTWAGMVPWEALGIPDVLPPDQLMVEFHGPPVPIRATATMSRDDARTLEQTRLESVEDTELIAEVHISEDFADYYAERGMGRFAIIAHMPAGAQVRFTRGNLGAAVDNYDAKPGMVTKNPRIVASGYGMKLLREIEETNNLDLANLKDADGNNVLDEGGDPIPIVWEYGVAKRWVELKSDIKLAAA